MTNWQPIETAPKDGTSILIYGRVYPDINIGQWVTDRFSGIEPDGEKRIDGWGDSYGELIVGQKHITHWMPLPEPPQ